MTEIERQSLHSSNGVNGQILVANQNALLIVEAEILIVIYQVTSAPCS